jgi:hypothetical protein
MRPHAVLLVCIALVCSPAVLGSALAESASPTLTDLQDELAQMSADIAELHAEVLALRARVKELEGPGPAVARAKEAEVAAIISAAERETAAQKPAIEEEEETAFTSGALGLQALNPEISVTGDFLTNYASGDDIDRPFDFTFRTLEVAFDSYLDPYSRMKAIVEFTPDETELGEAYFTRYGLAPSLNLTLGKFRQQLGVVNRWHKHGLDQIDFPLPLRQLFGPGGLNQVGASLEWQLPPLGGAAQDLTVQLTNGQNRRAFGQNSRNFPSLLAHYRNYRDLDKDTYLEFGITGLVGRNDNWDILVGDEIISQREDLWARVLAADLTLFWEPTQQMRYRNWLWRTEAYWLTKGLLAPDGSGEDTIRAWGLYSNYQRKLNRTLEAGLRVDYYEPDIKYYADLPGLSLSPLAVTESGAHQWMIAPYLTWWQSPWVRWRLEWDHHMSTGVGPGEDVVSLQCTYAAGPHKHERY